MRLNSINVSVEASDDVRLTAHERENGPGVYALHIETDLAVFASADVWRRIVKVVREELPDDLPLQAESH